MKIFKNIKILNTMNSLREVHQRFIPVSRQLTSLYEESTELTKNLIHIQDTVQTLLQESIKRINKDKEPEEYLKSLNQLSRKQERKRAIVDKKISAQQALLNQIEQEYIDAIKLNSIAHILVTFIYSGLTFLGIWLLTLSIIPTIKVDIGYYAALAQIFPLLFVAVFFQNRQRAQDSIFDQPLEKARRNIDAIILVVLGELMCLMPLASGINNSFIFVSSVLCIVLLTIVILESVIFETSSDKG